MIKITIIFLMVLIIGVTFEYVIPLMLTSGNYYLFVMGLLIAVGIIPTSLMLISKKW